MDELGKRLTADQADITIKRDEVRRLREQAKRLEAEADEIERLMYQARLQRS